MQNWILNLMHFIWINFVFVENRGQREQAVSYFGDAAQTAFYSQNQKAKCFY